LQVGAGIQIPPNASRVLASYGLLEKIQNLATEAEAIEPKRYLDGSVLTRRPLGDLALQQYGAPWLGVSRAPVCHSARFPLCFVSDAGQG
jgi:salicylate hydroxylase